MHRALSDVQACREILKRLGPLRGPMYPVYTTSLRFLDGFGSKAELLLYQNGFLCLEDLVQTILRQMRSNPSFNLFVMFSYHCVYMPPNVIRQMVVSIKRYLNRIYLLEVNCWIFSMRYSILATAVGSSLNVIFNWLRPWMDSCSWRLIESLGLFFIMVSYNTVIRVMSQDRELPNHQRVNHVGTI